MKDATITIDRCRRYVEKCRQAKKKNAEAEAIAFLLDGLDEATRIIEHLHMENQCIRRVMQSAATQLNVEPMTVGVELFFKDALLQMWKERRRQLDDAIIEAQKQRIADEKARQR